MLNTCFLRVGEGSYQDFLMGENEVLFFCQSFFTFFCRLDFQFLLCYTSVYALGGKKK
jgi:hypothetical protein